MKMSGGESPEAHGSDEIQTQHHHHLHIPVFHIGRHHQTLSRSESMVSLCFRNLSQFIEDDNFSGLQNFLRSKQCQIDDRDENGATALMFAACKGRVNFVQELLSHGADPNAEDSDNWSSLLCAAKEGYAEICQLLLDHGADIEQRDMGGWTSLMWATYKGHVETVVLLLDKNADANAHGNFHISSLIWASGRGYNQIVQELLRRGAKVNLGDKYGTSALIWASRKGYSDIVEMLLQAGANVDTAGMYSWTALLVATQGNYIDVVTQLLELKPNVNALDKDGCTALMIACKEGYYEIATALLNSGAYINVQDRAGDTNLIHAVKGGHRGIVEALLKKYADVDVAGKDRKTAIYTAVEKGNVQIVKLLLGANPDLEIATKDGDSPLLRAVRLRHVEIVQLLLDKRAKVSATDKKGDTVLHIAMRARSKTIIEILLRNPKNSQLLYRPNKQGETAYNIDLNHQKQILGFIFGARRLNTNEDNENMLGYDLYSSALADMLSEPSLSMPITVGLYAKWGSGKSFLLNKLRDEMKNFARQWVDPVFRFSCLLFLLIFHISLIAGVTIGIITFSWLFGLVTVLVLLVLGYSMLIFLWFVSHKHDWTWPYIITTGISRKLNSLRLILQVAFCHHPDRNDSDTQTAQPIRFFFSDQTKVSSTTGGENSVVQMVGSLYDAIESNYGSLPTRLFRAFRPKPAKMSSTWKFRKMCCLPYIIIFEVCFLCLLVGMCTICIYVRTDIPLLTKLDKSTTDSYNNYGIVTLNVIIITVILLLGITFIANIYTWAQMFGALIFSQRRHLQRAISKLETLKSEGFQQALSKEVSLMKNMVKCLDSLSAQQTRLVVIIDGLDSCEQDKVLLVLDAVHMLFSEANSPFIVILAVDPHVISKAVEMNSRRLFSESNIGGLDYLRNLVHLPFYLQNSGLRKVKIAQQTAQMYKKSIGWGEDDHRQSFARSLSSRRLSGDSTAMLASQEKLKPTSNRKGSRRLKVSESIASSIGSNLNVVVGAHDLTKMLLTDDYFSDVNPRSMRRLMNVVYVTGRLLKAFQVDFNWYHLASWVNITEQWPFRTSWVILYYDLYEDTLEDSTPLKILYDKVRPRIPTMKEQEPLLELDRDEKKFDIFLTFHRTTLTVSDLKIFLPFTINLDPYFKKVIKEEHQQSTFADEAGEGGLVFTTGVKTTGAYIGGPHWGNRSDSTGLPVKPRQRMFGRNTLPSIPQPMMYPQQPITWSPASPWLDHQQSLGTAPYIPPTSCALSAVTTIPTELFETKLSQLSVAGVCKLFEKIDDLTPNALSKYTSVIERNNVNGRVLLHCDMEELKNVLKMNFGDWEMFRVLIVSLREHELTSIIRQDEAKNVRFSEGVRERRSSNSKEFETKTKSATSKINMMEKQVTLEDQMIVGALQTLNEEACEDVLEEIEEEVPRTSLIPPSPEQAPEPINRSRTSSMGETDCILLQANPVSWLHWQPVSISSRGDGSHSENSSVCSTPLSHRKNDISVLVSQPETKKHSENYIMVDLKNVEDKTDSQLKEANRITENVHSSMYGQNRKHNIINKPVSSKMNVVVKSESVPRKKTVTVEAIHRTNSAKNLNHVQKAQRSRPSSLLVSKDDVAKTYLRSKSTEEPGRKNGTVLSCLRNPTPASSVEKLARLKERLLSSGVCDGDGDASNRHMDSDDESTPLVSDLSTPSASAEHNSAFSPQSDKLSSPSPDKNKTDSTEYSPISPVRAGNSATVSVSSVCNVIPERHVRDRSPPPTVLSTAGSDISLSFYLEAPNRFSNSSLASVASLTSDHSAPKTFSNSSGISRQNALDPDLDND